MSTSPAPVVARTVPGAAAKRRSTSPDAASTSTGPARSPVAVTVPRLRGGFGNVVWGVAACLLTIVSQALMRFAPGLGFDPLGLAAVSDSMRQDVLAQHPGAGDARR
jgi:hypothetical protein